MAPFPPRSSGVLVATSGDTLVAYDLITESRFRLDEATAVVLKACDGMTDHAGAVSEWATTAGADPHAVEQKVDEVLAWLREAGVVGRTEAWVPPDARPGAPGPTTPETLVSAPHLLLDLVVRFCGTDQSLLDQIDAYLGTATSASASSGQPLPTPDWQGATLHFGVASGDDGGIELVTDEVAGHDDVGTLLGRLVTVTTEYACDTNGVVALHAGGVRAPDGTIVVLPAVSEGGKSTLAAALVQSGWDYLGDEAIGVAPDGTALGFAKRLRLDPESCLLLDIPREPRGTYDPRVLRDDVRRLGGPVGPIGAVVFPSYQPGAALHIEPVDPPEHLDLLLANALNLARVGEPGFEALCRLAATTSAYRLVHGHAPDAATAIGELIA